MKIGITLACLLILAVLGANTQNPIERHYELSDDDMKRVVADLNAHFMKLDPNATILTISRIKSMTVEDHTEGNPFREYDFVIYYKNDQNTQIDECLNRYTVNLDDDGGKINENWTQSDIDNAYEDRKFDDSFLEVHCIRDTYRNYQDLLNDDGTLKEQYRDRFDNPWGDDSEDGMEIK